MPVEERGGGALVQRREQLRTVPRADGCSRPAPRTRWWCPRPSCAAASGRRVHRRRSVGVGPPAGRGARAAGRERCCRETAAHPCLPLPLSVPLRLWLSGRRPAPRSRRPCRPSRCRSDDEGCQCETTTPPTTIAAAATSSWTARRRRWAVIGTTSAAAGRAGATDGVSSPRPASTRSIRCGHVVGHRLGVASLGEETAYLRDLGGLVGTIVHGAPPSPAAVGFGGTAIGRATAGSGSA